MIDVIALGLVAVVYGIVAKNVAELWLGIFLISLAAVEPLTAFVKHEARLFRQVVRHDFEDRS